MNTVSEEGIEKINTTSKLVLRKRGDSAVEFYNAANRLYALRFIEVAEIGGHRVLYFLLRLAEGKRGGAPDKETGRMIVAVITQYLDEHPDATFSVPYTTEGAQAFLTKVHPFVEACELVATPKSVAFPKSRTVLLSLRPTEHCRDGR